MTCTVSLLLALAVAGTGCQAARLLRQDPSAVASASGQQPAGTYAVTGHGAEAGAASAAKGIRYNAGRVVVAGDGVPGPLATTSAGAAHTRSGNTAAEVNTNLGTEAVAATYEGARAVAGSQVSHMAADGAATSATLDVFRPRTVHNRGSVAFSDPPADSAAVTGQGNGPSAMAWGEEVASFSRSHRDGERTSRGVNLPRDGFDRRRRLAVA